MLSRKNLRFALAGLLATAVLAATGLFLSQDRGQKLAGRHSEYHKVYDGWWDVACDTAMDGSDRRCYVQYVDIYSDRPNFRAAMVEILFRLAPDGSSEPILTFDIEPDLSFGHVDVAVMRADGSEEVLPTQSCSGSKCSVFGEPAADMLAEWRKSDALVLNIRERGGEVLTRRWPLGKINAILDDFAAQRADRNLP